MRDVRGYDEWKLTESPSPEEDEPEVCDQCGYTWPCKCDQ